MQSSTDTAPMKPDLSLSNEALDELEAFLRSDAMPEDVMDLSTFDGYLAAIVLHPKLVAPGQWLHWLWDMEQGEESPAFAGGNPTPGDSRTADASALLGQFMLQGAAKSLTRSGSPSRSSRSFDFGSTPSALTTLEVLCADN